ncbi:4Fe-4S binding protein [Dethiobacter alkaliphilus]|uniref:4Fe-4S binding protein n=1 Tax=Dethiobacter alkaliphilus TaxID=427926 RepID=UPI002227C7BE|nr:4Fe-4S binding protein [Dethiobacter alkaliphilus]MCW3488914.1 4Fe-4S binding protein [Dethiobacter alkaliphilus]
MTSKVIIDYNVSQCTGCRLCMLACAWTGSKTHRLSDSAICIEVDEKLFRRSMILDAERCTGCLACVSICPGEALVKQDGETKGAGA